MAAVFIDILRNESAIGQQGANNIPDRYLANKEGMVVNPEQIISQRFCPKSLGTLGKPSIEFAIKLLKSNLFETFVHY